MKIHRFSLDHVPSGDELEVTDPKLLHQLQDVLELRVGETVQVFDPQTERLATVASTQRHRLVLQLGAAVDPLANLPCELHVAVSLLKGDAWDDMVREVSQLGVSSIQPLISERTIVRELTSHKRERYQTIAREATELSGGRETPLILEPQEFTDWIGTANPSTTFILDQSGEALANLSLPQQLWIVIGPEGGWTTKELAQAQKHNIKTLSLLPRVLTARFAPGAAAATILSCTASHPRGKSV